MKHTPSQVCDCLPATLKHHCAAGVTADEMCGDVLMEEGWEDGFTCTQHRDHVGRGPHRMSTTGYEEMAGTDIKGRKYHYVMTWDYDEVSRET